MNTKAVTRAKLVRAIAALEEAGQSLGGVELRPDGSVRLLVGPALAPQTPEAQDDCDDAELGAFRKQHGYG